MRNIKTQMLVLLLAAALVLGATAALAASPAKTAAASVEAGKTIFAIVGSKRLAPKENISVTGYSREIKCLELVEIDAEAKVIGAPLAALEVKVRPRSVVSRSLIELADLPISSEKRYAVIAKGEDGTSIDQLEIQFKWPVTLPETKDAK